MTYTVSELLGTTKQTHLANITSIIEGVKVTGESEIQKCWEYYRTEVAAKKETKMEIKLATVATRYAKFRLGQIVLLAGKYKVRIVDVACNGVWITRSATDAEFLRKRKGQIKERVSFNDLRAI